METVDIISELHVYTYKSYANYWATALQPDPGSLV